VSAPTIRRETLRRTQVNEQAARKHVQAVLAERAQWRSAAWTRVWRAVVTGLAVLFAVLLAVLGLPLVGVPILTGVWVFAWRRRSLDRWWERDSIAKRGSLARLERVEQQLATARELHGEALAALLEAEAASPPEWVVEGPRS
jgi:hypothetical protein